MKYIVTLNGKQYEVDVEKGQATAVLIGDAPASAPTPAQAAPVASPATVPTPISASGEVVAAPMPGGIFDVKCTAGQLVKAGDVLFILEAMKMENEICAPHDGVVKAVYVKKGDAVETDTPLCAL